MVESYVWEPASTRLVAREDGDFGGYSLYGDWLASGPDNVSILTYGRLSGSNGLGSWKAIVVHDCRRTGIRALWQSPKLAGLTAVARNQLITLRYAQPVEGAVSSARAWTYEVYAFEDEHRENPIVTLISRTTR